MADQYYDVYRAMAVEIPNSREHVGRRAFTPGEVDAMDVATVAVMLGVDRDGNATGGGAAGDAQSKMRELARRRAAGENVTWTDL